MATYRRKAMSELIGDVPWVTECTVPADAHVVFWDREEGLVEQLDHGELWDAVADMLYDAMPSPWYDKVMMLPDTLRVYAWVPDVVEPGYVRNRLGDVLEELDERYRCEWLGGHEPTAGMRAAWDRFVADVIREYSVTMCHTIGYVTVDVAAYKADDWAAKPEGAILRNLLAGRPMLDGVGPKDGMDPAEILASWCAIEGEELTDWGRSVALALARLDAASTRAAGAEVGDE